MGGGGGGGWEHLGTYFLYRHTEWVESKDLT